MSAIKVAGSMAIYSPTRTSWNLVSDCAWSNEQNDGSPSPPDSTQESRLATTRRIQYQIIIRKEQIRTLASTFSSDVGLSTYSPQLAEAHVLSTEDDVRKSIS